MKEHHRFGVFIFCLLMYSPALMTLFFTWALWLDKKHLDTTGWRHRTFHWALLAATTASLLSFPDGIRYGETQQPATGPFLAANWITLALWAFAIAGAIIGRGGGRICLLCWSVFLFLGVFGLHLALTP